MKQDIRKVKSIEDWIRYFSDNLGWEIDFDEIDDLDDITYDYEPEELGLKPESCAKIQSLKQLQPLTSDQPWGIFCIEFESKRFEITALRRILSSLIPRKRKYETEHKVWNLNDLLFICSWGEGNETTLGLAHFEERDGVLPQLKVIYCAPAKEDIHNITTFENRIGNLRWPDDPSDTEKWCNNWSAAFTSGYRETIHFAAELTLKLAEEARAIRDRILHTLEIETEQGYVHGLFSKFKEQLLHDMKEQDFADMYAQTIVYGLFSARCMDDTPETFSAAEAVRHIPNTNPFLKSLLQECLDVKTRSGISFDELEVGNVVDILARINPKEIVQDFGRQTGGGREDPVLHFYEEFLNAYDKTQKVQRGVYYTPQPVVNFIVRAVDDILKNEFGLKDGLASTETKLVEMPVEKAQKGASGLKTVMEKVEVPAVQVLDPATGTGTFLRQVILTIFENFKAAHKGEPAEVVQKVWNEYVPEHLLPRINGFELMMAPYAVAHMKLAMVLQETGYDFHSDKRLQVYLTNTLEEPGNSSAQLELFEDPLARESKEAVKIKKNAGISIILGNPPYSGGSQNKGTWILKLIEDYRMEPGGKVRLKEIKTHIDNDYVKFIRYAENTIDNGSDKIVAFINPRDYLFSPTFRGMRWQLLDYFDDIYIIDLHGDMRQNKNSKISDSDENVFDIQVGVCIEILVKRNNKSKLSNVYHYEIRGTRNEKFDFLNKTDFKNINFINVPQVEPFYSFKPQYVTQQLDSNVFSVNKLFIYSVNGIQTGRDIITIQNSKEEMEKFIDKFTKLEVEHAREIFNIGNDGRDWKIEWAQKDIINHTNDGSITPILYRPFDIKYTFYTGPNGKGFLQCPRGPIMQNMVNNNNFALIIGRQGQAVGNIEWCLSFISHGMPVDLNIFYRGGGMVFPLYIKKDDVFGM